MDKKQDRPDSLTLAGYLDGRLDQDQCERVERWLAESPDGADLLLSARRTMATPSPLPPDSLVRQAGALVDPSSEGLVAASLGRFWHLFYWPSTAALVLLSCLLGFQLAQSAMTEAGLVEPVVIDIRSATEAVFDLGESSGPL